MGILKNFNDFIAEQNDKLWHSIEDYIALIVVSILFSSFLFIVWIFYMLATSETVVLVKSEWHCAQTKPVTTVTYIQSGDVMVPIINTFDECVNYVRKY